VKRLSLKSEHLVELSNDELRQAGGAGADSFTGRVDCILSLQGGSGCVSKICLHTVLCLGA
jgi:hypothetical protein